jgi:hypothetical protein
MAPITPDDLRRRPGADVETNAVGHARRAKGDGEHPVRHLVIFPAPVLGAAPVHRAGA